LKTSSLVIETSGVGDAQHPVGGKTGYPIFYPTTARPAASAAGATILLTRVLLGLQPTGRGHNLETLAPPEIPSWAGEYTRLSGVRAFEQAWDVRIVRGQVEVEARRAGPRVPFARTA